MTQLKSAALALLLFAAQAFAKDAAQPRLPTVRTVVTRNTVSENASTMLWVVNLCTTAPVKLLVLQNAETRSTASDPR